MVVGPSAEPIIPIAPAVSRSHPKISAATRAANMPNWAAAPSNTVIGFWSMGVKSVRAPTPKNISNGNNSVSNPIFLSIPSKPSSSMIPVDGRFAINTPTPIGSSNNGSYPFAIPR